ncbi:MAG: hypothetical protein J7480_08745, partial [Microbacteriaceae bacterium]|nr:hypothetical protein [Microbacteriaceae bacterium]
MVVAPLTWPWAFLVITVAAAGIGVHFLLRHRARQTKRWWLLGLAVLNLGFSIAFNVAYLVQPAPETTFPPFQNLPLHLCTIMSWLMP